MCRPSSIFTTLILCCGIAFGADIDADSSNYRSKISQLQPGDTLVLAPGNYNNGLSVSGVRGTSSQWITIRSADKNDPAVFLARTSSNTAEITDCSYLAFEDLELDGRGYSGVFAFSAKDGTSNLTHHIRIQGCLIHDHSGSQQTVGISTKCPTWGWIIRGNTIDGAGTGIYLGNSNGDEPFVAGIIENNLIVNPEGYCMQIKHQNPRPSVDGMPTSPQVTLIRHNVFIKTDRPSGDGNRPNLLLGAFPSSGAGSQDRYDIYGNFFYYNPREYLMQAEARLAIHDNIFVSSGPGAINLGDHNGSLVLAYVYNNTIYGPSRGILLRDTPDEDGALIGNLVFADSGKSGTFATESGNVFDSVGNADDYVANPSFVLGQMDFYPVAGQAEGTALDLDAFSTHVDFDVDFNGGDKGTRTFRGAYAGDGTNPGWQLGQAIKNTEGAPPPPPPEDDTTPPTGTITIDGGATATQDTEVDLTLSASDAAGTVTQMRFSNDGATWSSPTAYATSLANWDLTAFGGDDTPGEKTVWARYRDDSGNWSSATISASIELLEQTTTPPPGEEPGTKSGAAGLELILLVAAAAWALRRRA